MQKPNPFFPTFVNLPKSLPIFPLAGAVFLPHSDLPLNVFEPRYVNMVRDAMRGSQLIGMIQPSDNAPSPDLYKVGCAGRITQYAETADGQIQIVLSGVCRFSVSQELDSLRGYRIIAPDWSLFEHDYCEHGYSEQGDTQSSSPALTEQNDSNSMASFKSALRQYFTENGIEADWSLLDKLSSHSLLSNLFSHLPLSVENKQLLLETPTASERLVAFTAILADESHPNSNRQ